MPIVYKLGYWRFLFLEFAPFNKKALRKLL